MKFPVDHAKLYTACDTLKLTKAISHTLPLFLPASHSCAWLWLILHVCQIPLPAVIRR